MFLTPLYASLLALLFIFLSVRVLRLRRRLGIPLGNNRNPEMLRAMRVQANFAEYAPLTLLLMLLLELQGGSPYVVNLLGLILLIGRAVHAFGLSRSDEDYRYRVLGMAMTFTALGTTAVMLLVSYLARFAA